MTTRTYYLPKSQFSLQVINHMITKVGCSIGELKVCRQADAIRVPVTCNDNDVEKVSNILQRFNMMGEGEEYEKEE